MAVGCMSKINKIQIQPGIGIVACQKERSKFDQNPRPNWILFIFDMQKIQFSGLIWILFIFDMQKLRNKEGFFRSFCMSKINKIQINPENWIFCMSKINKSNLEVFFFFLVVVVVVAVEHSVKKTKSSGRGFSAVVRALGLLCPWSRVQV